MLIERHPGMRVVGEAGRRAEALAIAAHCPADIVLLDLDLDGEMSLDFLQDLIRLGKDVRVIIFTGISDPALHRRAVRLGAAGLVLKEKASAVLLKAIELVHAGEVWLDRTMTASVLSELTRVDDSTNDPEKTRIASLTRREHEIISLVCKGLKNNEIASLLFISEATVRNHLTSILSKLMLSDRFELALFSYRNGLGKPPA
jgi:DNA-binding NarL/FixJ family response regulator